MSDARLRFIAAPVGIALFVGVFLVPAPAFAEDPPPLETMLEFPSADFAEEAAALPPELVEVLDRDVDLTPDEYLAQGAAAVLAIEVVESIENVGVEVLGSRLEGTELVVNVESAEDAAIVESTGATAELGDPAPLWDPSGHDLEFAADVYDGQGWTWQDTQFRHQCSVGFTGYLANGTPQLATAGHCTASMVGNASIFNQSAPGQTGSVGATIGTKVAGTSFFGSGNDVGRISSGGSGIVQKSSALTWGMGSGAPLAFPPSIVNGRSAAIEGQTACKSGSRTGWSCGTIVDVDYEASVGGVAVNSIVAALCVLPGDSGGIALASGGKGLGITSWTTTSQGCNSDYTTHYDSQGQPYVTGSYAGFFPLVSSSGGASVTQAYGATWELAATVSSPTITSISSSGASDTAINGSVSNPGIDYKVDVFVDGSTTAFATANVSASTGAWSVGVTSLAPGIHTFSAVARYGTWSKSTPTTGFVKRGMSIDRIFGANRFETSAAIASRFSGSNTIYLANGLKYPDALSAASAAGSQNAPLLLTGPDELPPSIAEVLDSVAPSRLVVLGGVDSISSAVFEAAKAIVLSHDSDAQVVRLAGSDRFATSLLISADAFPTSSTAYVATGLNFPDALSAAAAAGNVPAPVILVNGSATTLDTATRDMLEQLDVTTVKIAGSYPSVSAGVEAAIDSIPGVSVQRLAGSDRFKTSVDINTNAFTTSNAAYLAYGLGFPDALSGGALAGQEGVPLFVVRGDCVPQETLAAMRSMGVTTVHLLGSSSTLDANVFALRSC